MQIFGLDFMYIYVHGADKNDKIKCFFFFIVFLNSTTLFYNVIEKVSVFYSYYIDHTMAKKNIYTI